MKPILTCTALKFKLEEINTIERIFTRSLFGSSYPELNNAIEACYSRYKGAQYWRKKSFDFTFVSDFDIEIERYTHRIIIHASILGDYDFVSYSLGIAHRDDSSKLIRRFHFDYDHGKVRLGQKAFISHLQYGGVSGGGFSGANFTTELIEPKLSVPRLNFPPINLALLLDIVFCEFQNDDAKKIVEDPEWRSLIKDNEVFILKQYYNSISNHIGSDRHNKDTLVRDICYA